MNPFEFRGPEFLFFYFLLCVAVVLVLTWLRDRREGNNGSAMPRLTNPYTIAFLRAGKNEVLRIATMCLIDRGYLEVTADNKIVGTKNQETRFLTEPLNRKIVEYYGEPAAPSQIFDVMSGDPVFDSYQGELETLDLMPGAQRKEQRFRECLNGAFLLAGVALMKIVMALTSGRSSVGFLMGLTAIAFVCVVILYKKRRTEKGDEYLAGLKELVSYPGSINSTAEMALAAAVFGVGAVPLAYFPNRDNLFGKAAKNDGGSSSSGCGSCGSSSTSTNSSCGSSSSDSGSSSSDSGSSCGGGGGGCGGCGS